jgi:hypothetical protein
MCKVHGIDLRRDWSNGIHADAICFKCAEDNQQEDAHWAIMKITEKSMQALRRGDLMADGAARVAPD